MMRILFVLLIMVSLGLAGCGILEAEFERVLPDQNQSRPIEEPAPNFTLTTFDGKIIALSDFRGKVIVLNFWASWCAPCLTQVEELQATWEIYEDSSEVVFIGIAFVDLAPRSLEFLEQRNISYLNGADTDNVISDAYGVQGVPETYVIDQQANIVDSISSFVSQEQLVEVVDDLLNK